MLVGFDHGLPNETDQPIWFSV